MNTSKVISRRSNLVLISVLITIIIIVFSIVSFLHVVNDIQKLTNFINSTGSIRGGIQRVTKLYLLNQDIKESVKMIDKTNFILSDFLNSKTGVFNSNDKVEFSNLLQSWTEYKEILKNNQKDRILNSSENLWKLSNIVVNKIEIKTHNHIALQYLFLFLLFSIVCILGLVGFFIRKVVQENIEKKASHDQLTNLLNRNYLHQIYNVKLSDSLRKSSFLAVLICDIDHFKYVNDTFGHDVGDKVLKRIAEIMVENTRENDAIFRYGGEEFLILVSFTEIPQLIQYAERLRSSVESTEIIEHKITISVGVSLIDDKQELKQHILRADTALYKAKQAGRNRVIVNELNLTTAST